MVSPNSGGGSFSRLYHLQFIAGDGTSLMVPIRMQKSNFNIVCLLNVTDESQNGQNRLRNIDR